MCYSYQILVELKFSQQIFEEYINIKFNQSLSSGSRVIPCGRTDTKKVGFRNFETAPKNEHRNKQVHPDSHDFETVSVIHKNVYKTKINLEK
jgi:hypothetical protein